MRECGLCFCGFLFFEGYGDHRDLHVLTHSCPTRRSSDLLPRQSALKTSANQRLALSGARLSRAAPLVAGVGAGAGAEMLAEDPGKGGVRAEAADRKSTRLNSSH